MSFDPRVALMAVREKYASWKMVPGDQVQTGIFANPDGSYTLYHKGQTSILPKEMAHAYFPRLAAQNE